MKVLLVDGYNVVRSTPPYQSLAECDLAAAREALVTDVAAFAQGAWDATVVFDGAGNPASDGGPHEIAGITVIFSRYQTSADSVIEALARAARDRAEEVEVVTSDAQTQWAVLGGRVTRRSAKEFASELRAQEGEWQECVPAGETSSRIEDRIDPDVAATLSRWARGED